MPDEADVNDGAIVPGIPNHIRPEPDMRYRYANNVFFDTSIFDIKMMFGELRRDGEGAFVAQHTSITMAWSEAKVAAIFFALNVMLHEDANGPIALSEGIRPPQVVEPDEINLPIRDIFEAALRRYRIRPKEEPTKEQPPN